MAGDLKGTSSYAAAGVDIDALGQELQVKGAESFVGSWNSLVARIQAKAGQA